MSARSSRVKKWEPLWGRASVRALFFRDRVFRRSFVSHPLRHDGCIPTRKGRSTGKEDEFGEFFRDAFGSGKRAPKRRQPRSIGRTAEL